VASDHNINKFTSAESNTNVYKWHIKDKLSDEKVAEVVANSMAMNAFIVDNSTDNDTAQLITKYAQYKDATDKAQAAAANAQEQVDKLADAIDEVVAKSQRSRKTIKATTALGVSDVAGYLGIDVDEAEAARLNDLTVAGLISELNKLKASAKEKADQANTKLDNLQQKYADAETDLNQAIARLTPATPAVEEDEEAPAPAPEPAQAEGTGVVTPEEETPGETGTGVTTPEEAPATPASGTAAVAEETPGSAEVETPTTPITPVVEVDAPSTPTTPVVEAGAGSGSGTTAVDGTSGQSSVIENVDTGSGTGATGSTGTAGGAASGTSGLETVDTSTASIPTSSVAAQAVAAIQEAVTETMQAVTAQAAGETQIDQSAGIAQATQEASSDRRTYTETSVPNNAQAAVYEVEAAGTQTASDISVVQNIAETGAAAGQSVIDSGTVQNGAETGASQNGNGAGGSGTSSYISDSNVALANTPNGGTTDGTSNASETTLTTTSSSGATEEMLESEDHHGSVSITDEQTALSMSADSETIPEKKNFWWIMLIAIFGAAGEKMYKEHMEKKKESTDEINK
jgi:hypothetical protein